MEKRYTSLALGLMSALTLCVTEADAQRTAPRARPVPHVRTTAPHPGGFHPELRGSAPANDECAAAQALTIHTEEECATMATSGDNGASVTSTGDPSCDASDSGYQDVWYSFNSGTNQSVFITLTSDAAMTDWAFVVSTSCAATEDIGCAVTPVGAVEVPVTENTDYIIRVYSNLQYGVGGPFTICVTGGGLPPPPPANDECAAAEAITVHTMEECATMSTTGNNGGSVVSTGDPSCDSGSGYQDVWYSFNSGANELIDVTLTPSVGMTDWAFVISTACGATDDIACEIGPGGPVLVTVTPNTDYVVRVYSNVDWGEGDEFTICLAGEGMIPDPPANDECAGAIQITPAANCVDVAGTGAGATESMPAIECNTFTGNADDDVWYYFTASSTDQTISVQGYGGMDAVIELFSGACGDLTSMACGDNTYPPTGVEDIGDSLSMSGFTVGSTYYFRVYDFNTSPNTHAAFAVCVQDGLNSSLGVGEHTTAGAVTVFPNPGNGDFTLTYNATGGAVGIQVLDMTGRVVHNGQRTLTQGQSVALPLAGKLAVGQYLLRLDTPDGRKEQRLSVQ